MKYQEPTPKQRLAVLQAANATDGLIDRVRLKEICPLSDPSIWRLTQSGEFPPMVKLGRRSVWRLSSVLFFCQQAELRGK